MSVDVLDCGKISNTGYVLDHLRMIVDADGLMHASAMIGTSSVTVVDWLERKTTMNLKTVAKIGELMDLSIAEMMVKPGIATEWYREADVKYFAQNLVSYLEELCESKVYMARCLGISKSMLQGYMNGGMKPRLPMLQRLADALDVEVADLFLPVE